MAVEESQSENKTIMEKWLSSWERGTVVNKKSNTDSRNSGSRFQTTQKRMGNIK